jgi:hypothetical protein
LIHTQPAPSASDAYVANFSIATKSVFEWTVKPVSVIFLEIVTQNHSYSHLCRIKKHQRFIMMSPANDRWLTKNVEAEERSEQELVAATGTGTGTPSPEWSRRDDKDVDEILGMGDHAPPVHQMTNENMMTIIGMDNLPTDGNEDYFIDDDQEDVSTLANDTVANGTFFRDDRLSPPRQIRQKSNEMFQSNEFTPSPAPKYARNHQNETGQSGKISPTSTQPETPPKGGDILFYGGKYETSFSRRFFRLAVIATILGVFLIAAIAVLSVNYHQIETDRTIDAEQSGPNLRNPQGADDASFEFTVKTFSPTAATPAPTTAPTKSAAPTPTWTAAPTNLPSTSPTMGASATPSVATPSPTTSEPSQSPSSSPTAAPSSTPSTSLSPTAMGPTTTPPTDQPTTAAPTTEGPTMAPTTPLPTMAPTTGVPTTTPTTSAPTANVPLELVTTIINAPNFPYDTITAIQERDTTSIGYQVVEWMARDPNLDTYDKATIIQRFALSCFFKGLTSGLGNNNNPMAATWMTYTDFCDWTLSSEEESLCNANGQPQSIYLENYGLTGEIVPELLLLGNSLEILVITNNNIHGTLPTELGLLTEMRRIRTHNNQLEGTLPTELGMWKQLCKFLSQQVSIALCSKTLD